MLHIKMVNDCVCRDAKVRDDNSTTWIRRMIDTKSFTFKKEDL